MRVLHCGWRGSRLPGGWGRIQRGRRRGHPDRCGHSMTAVRAEDGDAGRMARAARAGRRYMHPYRSARLTHPGRRLEAAGRHGQAAGTPDDEGDITCSIAFDCVPLLLLNCTPISPLLINERTLVPLQPPSEIYTKTSPKQSGPQNKNPTV